jgi:flagellar hook assembly protein FlgD
MGSVKLLDSPFNPLAAESMRLQYNFRDTSNTLSCVVYDLSGSKRHTVADYLPVNQSGEITWNGRDHNGRALPRGIYILKVSARDSSGRYFLQKQLTVVLATK